MIPALLVALASALPLASAHASIWHPSMWGFNVTDHTYPYDNRPVSPLSDMTFQQWWFHGHLDHPPNPGDVFQLPAGQAATTEIACNKGATTFFASSEGGDIRSGDDPCPGSPPSEYHTNGPDDLKGCSLAIAYKNDVNQVKPEDFSVFSVNNTCVFHRFTDFQVPARMPPCPEGGCICAWFWVHSQDSGGEQNYMNGFRCNITGSTSNVPVAKSQVPRRCGADPDNGKMQNAPGNCTYGAKQPFYWFQKEQNNMFEGTYAPPFYLPLYNFLDGAQNDIFEDSYPSGIPPPGPNSTVVPTPFLGGAAAVATLPPSQASLPSSIPSSSITPSSSLVPTSAVSLASASLTSVAPSTATVTSVLFVTITNTVTPSSTIASSTIQSQVAITNGVSGTPATSIQSPTPSVPISGTPIQLNNPSFSPLPSTVGVSPNETTGQQFAQLERVTGMGIDSNSSATSDTSSPASPLSTSATAEKASVCKRGSAPGLSKRSPPSFSKYIPGMRSHRRMQKRSSLWHLF